MTEGYVIAPDTVRADVLDQHLEDAAFTWTQRERAVRSPHHRLNDLAEIDDRLTAHLAGLAGPANANYMVVKQKDNDAARARYMAQKKKAKVKGTYHHPHTLKTGGCPVHQELIKKPEDPAQRARVDAVDKEIDGVVQQAALRGSG
jgi:hypothetical protein